MTNVSKQLLSKEEEQALMKQFAKLFHQRSPATLQALCVELLTPAEQVMLMKRLAIIIMLRDELSTYEIARSLKVSATTVSFHARQYTDGAYDTIIKTVYGKGFDHKKFWNIVDVILRAGLPPMAGPGRWGTLAPVRGTRSK